jgi:hypothetical protein
MKADPRHSRQAIWAVARALAARGEDITVPAIRAALPGSARPGRIGEYLVALEAAGILERDANQSPRPGAATRYTLARDTGAEAPRVRQDGTFLGADTDRQRIWTALRVLRMASAAELVATIATPERPASLVSTKDYLDRLVRAGLIGAREGRPGRPRIYLLARHQDTGPTAPVIRRREVAA